MNFYKTAGLLAISLLISSCNSTIALEPQAPKVQKKSVNIIEEKINQDVKVVENRVDIKIEDSEKELTFEEAIGSNIDVIDEVSPEVSPIASEVSGQE